MRRVISQGIAWRAIIKQTATSCFEVVWGSSRQCGIFGRLVMVLCLLPWAFVRRCGGRCTAGTGKQWFVSLLETAPEAMWMTADWGRLRRWAVLVPLVFAQRIRREHGFFPAVWKTMLAVRQVGRIALIAALDPQTGVSLPPERWVAPMLMREVLGTLAKVPPATYVHAEDVSIVIPVYNGMEHLERLIPALRQHTPEEARIIFIDDASPDTRVRPFLEESLHGRKNVLLLHNEQNLGFTATVNCAMAHVKTAYAVLLNTDTLMCQGWLPRLIAPFSAIENRTASHRIASVTPFSNAAVFFSFPIRGQDNDFIPPFSLEECDTAFAGLNATIDENCDIHSGVGFCMAVSMDCWHAVGPLDEKAFARGYGEECDWCMRAAAHGWRNVLVPNLFILHAHGGSFLSEEKQRLCMEHQKILQQRWPGAMRFMMEHVRRDPWKNFRAMAAWRMTAGGKGCLLMVDLDSADGGAVAYREKQIAELTGEGWRVLLLRYTAPQGRWFLSCRHLLEERPVLLDKLEDLEHFLSAVPVARVFINNFAFHPHVEDVVDFFAAMKLRYGFHLHYVFHDFLSLCPSFFLMDADMHFCRDAALEKCRDCAPYNKNRILDVSDVARWRKHWKAFLELCDSLTCFSESSREIINHVYPLGDRLEVREHEPLLQFGETFHRPQPDGCIELAFIGNFTPVKGSEIARALMGILLREGIDARLHIFGLCGATVPELHIVDHGPYEKKDLPELLRSNRVAAIIFPSIYPETFSYVAQECMALRAPLVCFDLGAPPERIRKYAYPHAVICRDITAESMVEALDSLLQQEYGRHLREVR